MNNFSTNEPIIIHIAGFCHYRPRRAGEDRSMGPGGFAAALSYRGHTRLVTGGHPGTTDPRMVMHAAIAGLNAIKTTGSLVRIVTDCQFLVNGMNEWPVAWEKQGLGVFEQASRGINGDLMVELFRAANKFTVEWVWDNADLGVKRAKIEARKEADAEAQLGMVGENPHLQAEPATDVLQRTLFG